MGSAGTGNVGSARLRLMVGNMQLLGMELYGGGGV